MTLGDLLRKAADHFDDQEMPIDVWLTVTFSAKTDSDGRMWLDGVGVHGDSA